MKLFNTTKTGYRFNRIMFNVILFVVILFGFLIVKHYNFDFSNKIYMNCPGIAPCENPLYPNNLDKCNADFCKGRYISPGEHGSKEPAIIPLFGWGAFFLFCCALALNHYLYNKGKTPIDLSWFEE